MPAKCCVGPMGHRCPGERRLDCHHRPSVVLGGKLVVGWLVARGHRVARCPCIGVRWLTGRVGWPACVQPACSGPTRGVVGLPGARGG